MNSDHEKRLESEIDAALKSLPELKAPQRLAQRVLARTTQRAAVAWHRQSWEMWPTGLRAAALAVMLGSFAVLCIASWQLTQAAGMTLAAQEVGRLFSSLASVWNVVSAIVFSLVLALKHIHPALLAGAFLVLALAWSTCIGLGTAFVKLALARR